MSDAFISYSRTDSAFADKLLHDLEARGIPVWIDRDNIEGGAAWRASISTAIRSCCAFVLILSPRSTQSGQVSKELSVAETHNRLIIPVVIEKCDIPPGMELQLAELQWISFAEHPYEVALERLTRVIKEARSQAPALPASDAASSSGEGVRPTNEILSSASRTVPSPSGPTSTTVPSPSGGGSGWGWSASASGSNRKWLLAGSAAVAAAAASLAAFQFSQDRGASTPPLSATRTETKAGPVAATPAVALPVVAAVDDPKPAMVPAVTGSAPAEQQAEAPKPKRAAPAPSTPSGSQQGATRSEAQQRTVSAQSEKPVVVARADPAPEKAEIVARADPAPQKPKNPMRADTAPAQASGPIVGNNRTLLYHFPGCPGYSRISAAARTEFSTARDAERAGYKLSDNCSDPSGGRPAAAVIANSRTHDYFLPHCSGYAATRPEYRVSFNSTAEAEKAGYKRSDKCS
jgi:hypothetical protein